MPIPTPAGKLFWRIFALLALSIGVLISFLVGKDIRMHADLFGLGSADLLAEWKLASDANDSSGNGLNATASAEVLFAPDAIDMPTADFSNAQSCVEVPHSSALNIDGAMTLSGWFKPSQAANANLFSRIDLDQKKGYLLSLHNGKVEFRAFGTSGRLFGVDSESSIEAGRWHHLAVRFVPGEGIVDIVVDGEVVGSATTRETAIDHVDAALRIGCPDNPDSYSEFTEFASVSTGKEHACALTADGEAWCWGNNRYGQLGTGSTSTDFVTEPVRVAGDHVFETISVGNAFTCAKKEDGSAWCWGTNGNGRLGHGNTTSNDIRTEPNSVTGGHTFQKVDAGGSHACGLDTDSNLWCWGFGGYGQLGNGANSNQGAPVQVSGYSGIRDVATGAYHTCFEHSNRKAYCMGRNHSGQLGAGISLDQGTNLRPVAVNTSYISYGLFAGGDTTCMLRSSSGRAMCWGANKYGQLFLGNNSTERHNTPQHMPHSFPNGIVLSGLHSCGIRTNDAVCAGYNVYGALGNGSTANTSLTPTFMQSTDGRPADISLGFYNSCFIKTGGRLMCAGRHSYGVVGNGQTSGQSNTPVNVDVEGITVTIPAENAGGSFAQARLHSTAPSAENLADYFIDTIENIWLLARFSFDSDFSDVSIYSRVLTALGGATINASAGVDGGALELPLASDAAVVADSVVPQDDGSYTVMAWMRPNDATALQTALSTRQGGISSEKGVTLGLDANGAPNATHQGASRRFSSSHSSLLGEWVHVAGVFTGSAMQLFLDGALVATDTSGTSANGGTRPVELLLGGMRAAGSAAISNGFAGLLDEVRVYDRALPAAKIANIYTQTAPKPLAHFNFDGDLADSQHSSVALSHSAAPTFVDSPQPKSPATCRWPNRHGYDFCRCCRRLFAQHHGLF